MAEKVGKSVNYLRPWMILFWIMLLAAVAEYWGVYYQIKNNIELANFQASIARQMSPELFYRNLLITLVILGVSCAYVCRRLQRLIAKQVLVQKMDTLLYNITRCQDGQIIEHAQQLGILVNGRSARLSAEVMAFASPEHLADLVTALFYIHREEIISQLRQSSYEVFYSLADELAKYWKDQRLDDFIAHFKENKLLFGSYLASALEKRAYQNQIAALEAQIQRIQEDEAHRLDDLILNGLIEKNLASVQGKIGHLLDARSLLAKLLSKIFDSRSEPALADNLGQH